MHILFYDTCLCPCNFESCVVLWMMMRICLDEISRRLNLDKIFPLSSIFVAQRTTESVIIHVSGVHVSKTE